MIMRVIGKYLALVLLVQATVVLSQEEDESEAKKFLNEYNTEKPLETKKYVIAQWNYDTDLTDENSAIAIAAAAEMAKYDIKKAEEATKLDQSDLTDSEKREFEKIMNIGTANLTDSDHEKLEKLNAELVRIYSTAEVGDKPGDSSGKKYRLDPDLTDIMASSEDLKTLEWAWKGWRDAAGKPQREKYKAFTDLQNKAAHNNGYADHGEYMRSVYESDSFKQDIEELYQTIKPFYEELHAYVRMKLKQKYKDLEFPEEGHIPAHVLGNMWAQSWENLEDLVKPLPEKPSLDITDELKKQNYDVDRIFKTSEQFFVDIDMPKMTQEFWTNSMLKKPKDKEVVCHASAWDFYDKKDFRIKQCTEVNHKWFMTTHHEMGHVVYYEQYKNQPIQFRTGANPGFHEAQADIASLSVATPAYLKHVGLLKDYEETGDDLNFLMQQALTKLAFLPFGYLIDLWRWDLYSGATTEKEYNAKWWEARCKYQGLSSPVERTENDFDAGAKFHVPNNTPYIRYFVAHILQYQFHEALCKEAGITKPLHQCSIHGNKKAGEKLREMLTLGASKPWPEALKALTGSDKMSAESLLNYFKPLRSWLQEQIKDEKKGWKETCPPFDPSRGGSSMKSVSQIMEVFAMVVNLVARIF